MGCPYQSGEWRHVRGGHTVPRPMPRRQGGSNILNEYFFGPSGARSAPTAQGLRPGALCGHCEVSSAPEFTASLEPQAQNAVLSGSEAATMWKRAGWVYLAAFASHALILSVVAAPLLR